MVADFEAVKHLVEGYASDVSRVFPVDKVMLFGSYAKGLATEQSDITGGLVDLLRRTAHLWVTPQI